MAIGRLLSVTFAACCAFGAAGCIVTTSSDPGPVVVDEGALLYERCVDDLDCDAAADGCYEVDTDVGVGAMCSAQCFDASDCLAIRGGVGAVCYGLAGDPSGISICYEQCDFESDCAVGLSCTDALDPSGALIDRICVPND